MMQACVYYAAHKALRLEQREKPAFAAGCGAVIAVAACSICGTDLRTYRFGSGKIDDGRIVGHEVVGRILELDDRWRADFAEGDTIALAPAIGCGVCASCKKGRPNMCDQLRTIGFQYDGGFAEYMAVPGAAFERGNVYKLPPSDNYGVYTLSEPLACALNGQSFLGIGPEDDVLIFGAGMVGCFHAELARLSRARSLSMVEPSEQRRSEAAALLPDVAFLPAEQEALTEAVRARTGGEGMDVVIVACSVGAAQAQGMRLLAKGGRISLFGGLSGESSGFIDSNLVHYRELSVYGVHASTPAQNRQAMRLIHSGQVDAAKYITGYYPLSDIERTLASAARGELMKAVMVNRVG